METRMSHYGNPNQPGSQQWNYQQVQNQLRHSRHRRQEEQRRRDFLSSQQRRREEQHRRDRQVWAQHRRRTGGHGPSAGLWILQIIVAVVALIIILSNIT
jgi:Flp pilus assembly protein TadB